ncbi:amino acid adenylation domain-containing protein [Streptomyces sp. NPDC059631]|uniref:amino acid adenylation domain-containing protein n=1 Tax=unclassified Streptomyces TaxID=2593676 RepID=UPI0036BF044E
MHPQQDRYRAELSGRRTACSFPAGVPGLIREAAGGRPDAVAVECAGESLTYRQLELWSDELGRLLGAEAPPGRPVAVAVPRGVHLPVALLAVWKAGLSYLPLDADDPPERLRRVLDVSRSTLALVTDATRSRVAGPGLRTVTVPARFEGAADAEPAPLPPVSAEQPVYVLFTSGSTGTPKGVVLASTALANRLVWMRDAYGVGPGDRVLQKTPVTFDVSGWELWLPLISGGTCVLLPPEEHRDPGLVARAIRQQGITLCHFVPTMLREFLRHRDAARCTSLRHVYCSGEPLPLEVARTCVNTLPAALHNLYGPTEAAIDVSHWTVPASAPDIERVLIGRPVDNCTLLVVGEDGRTVPRGGEGELCIGGVPLALGYLDDPERTARAFVPAPAGSAVRRMYRTGDRVRLGEGGLEYLGRTDDQVKIRGQRIEPQEIEHHLRSHPSVEEAVVVAVRTGEDTALVAWVRGAGADVSSRALTSALRTHLASVLPPAYVPAHYAPLDEVPLTSSGKLDRAALRSRAAQRLGTGRMASGSRHVPPAGRPLLAALLRERDARTGTATSREDSR